jgi:hypothetical protein
MYDYGTYIFNKKVIIFPFTGNLYKTVGKVKKGKIVPVLN